jgi:NADH-quinone oxidoreductase subunit D
MRIGGVSFDVPDEWYAAVNALIAEMPARISEYEELLLDNEILLARSRDVGKVSPEVAINASASGPVLRGCGIAWDVRKADPYCLYDRFEFDIPVGHNGDCFDRFIVRLEEMRQSVHIVEQALADLPNGPVSTPVPLALRPEPGEAYVRIESPKGELGFYLVSDGGPAPYRWHVRSPSFINLSTLKDLSVGGPLADAIVILGSLDINVGEIDR